MSNESTVAMTDLKAVSAMGFSICKQRVLAMIQKRDSELGYIDTACRPALRSLYNEILELKERD